MSNFISLILILLCLQFYAQDKIISGKVIDSQNQPLPFVSIGIVGTSLGTISDENGNFVFYLPNTISKTDSLKISSIGFVSEKYLAINLTETLIATLITELVALPEVIVRSQNLKTKIVGNKDEETFMNCNFTIGNKPNQNLGAEIGRKFFFKGKNHCINKLNLYAAYNFDTVLLRLNIYSLKNGLPDQNLLTENIILKLIGKKRGWTEFNLDSYNLVYDQNVVVSLQWIGHSKKGKDLQLPITMPAFGAIHFYKMGSQDKWKRYNNMSTTLNLEVAIAE